MLNFSIEYVVLSWHWWRKKNSVDKIYDTLTLIWSLCLEIIPIFDSIFEISQGKLPVSYTRWSMKREYIEWMKKGRVGRRRRRREEEEEEEQQVASASPARPADRRLSRAVSVSGEGPAGRAPAAPPRWSGRPRWGSEGWKPRSPHQVISGDEAPTGGQPHLPTQPRSTSLARHQLWFSQKSLELFFTHHQSS